MYCSLLLSASGLHQLQLQLLQSVFGPSYKISAAWVSHQQYQSIQ